ncbi:alpha/beta-hydrolase [Eremomyces bilateralis CBS 781.70]|uniref:Alpha/beta-hydrolase n=1 Tax=Eremomyces bilateralis CBS 781.70 TaxID=1392243 RepID=A0A6G1FVM0_9PEZI|nr:alpha/beta-hydrolase [Eremomyces bilateralis CBS 781.70]KAF1809760.1 alpha/beta-hydrolase [Eremomyces bilateralis CBS 781.70]
MSKIQARQPFKALYALCALTFELIRFPVWILTYLIPPLRPNPKWTFRQALMTRIVRSFLYHSANVEVRTPLSLRPGGEKKQFVVLSPANASFYEGPVKDEHIKPEKIGGTWYPEPFPANGTANVDVVLNFHGGGYVIGDGRTKDAGFTAATLLKTTPAKYVFCPQYRLASNPDSRFPAAVQDAITSYVYLTKTLGIPSSRIIFSGDSAGGNLVLALLRFLAEFGEQVGLSHPACAFLWSPWVDLEAAIDPANIRNSPHESTDYLCGAFGAWGGRSYISDHNTKLDPRNPYISPLHHPFRTPVPLFVQSGGAEVLFHDHVELVERFGDGGKKDIGVGNTVKLFVTEHAPHDIALVGHLLGFKKEFVEAVRGAAKFLEKYRYRPEL